MARSLNSPWYLYFPTKWVGYVFLILFTLTTLAHLFQAIRYRRWWLIFTVVGCGIGEVITWATRLAASYEDFPDYTGFDLQFCASIVAPIYLVAGMYIALARIAHPPDGRKFSIVPSLAYIIYAITFVLASLVVQIVFGVIFGGSESDQTTNDAAKITLGNVITQLAITVLFLVAVGEVWIRGSRWNVVSIRQFERNSRTLILAMLIAAVFVITRTVFRVVEVRGNWENEIRAREALFCGLDGAPMVIAMFILNVFHPGRLLPPKGSQAAADASEKANLRGPSPVPV